MKRRTVLLGIGAATAGSATLFGTGAFTSVSANRDVAVDVADDSDAFLQIQPATDGSGNELPNAQYAQETNGTVELNFTDGNNSISGGGGGFNADAETGVSEVFEVRNQGTQEVEVALQTSKQDDTSTNGTVIAPSSVSVPGDRGILLVITAHNPPSTNPLDPVPLAPGERQQFSVTASVRDSIPSNPPGVLDTDEITIQAEATQ